METPDVTNIPMFTATHRVTGQKIEIPQDLIVDLNRDFMKGFAQGFTRGFLTTTGLLVVTVGVAAGVAIGTSSFLQWRERRKDIDTSTDTTPAE